MILCLVGMMGVGKASAGRLAAERLGVEFVDVDDVVATEAGSSIPELWDRLGESGFRSFESAVIKRVAGTKAVVSTGGGAVLDGANRRRMRNTGRVVWLRAEPAVLERRIEKAGDRPSWREIPIGRPKSPGCSTNGHGPTRMRQTTRSTRLRCRWRKSP